MKYRKLIIIGAPRSGTNMLRDALCRLPGFATWDCDEINPIWKHGHLLSHPLDDLPASDASPQLRVFVRERFDRIARGTGSEVIVEKTCANSVRVNYLRALLPEAEFLLICRHGADAVSSAIGRWRSSLPLRYTLKKLRYVPLQDLPVYAVRFGRNRISQWFDAERRLRAWGPMTREISAAAGSGDVVRAASWQWRECVERALADLPSSHSRVRYEDLVREPRQQLRRIVEGLNREVSDASIVAATVTIRSDLVGQGQSMLRAQGLADVVAPIINPGLQKLGYASL